MKDVPEGRIAKPEQNNLKGLTGWWRSQGKDCIKEGKYNEKEKLQSGRKEREDRISFIQRYFPSFSQSPGNCRNWRVKVIWKAGPS